jgi:hypothetical protein
MKIHRTRLTAVPMKRENMMNDESEGQGFRQIGNPMKNVERLLTASGSMQTEQPTNSGTIGQACQEPREQSSTGLQRGATGVDALRDLARKDPHGPMAINAGLRRGVKPATMSWQELNEPPTAQEILQMLKVLRAKTIRRSEDPEDMEIAIIAYGEELTRYPADIVRHVLKEQPRKSKWFPSWFDLGEELNFWNFERQRQLDRIGSAVG